MNKGRIRRSYYGVLARFDEQGDSFSLNVPHKNVWDSLCRLLVKRGFTVSPNPCYEQHYKPISKHHKLAIKGDVVVMLEITANSISCHIENRKNVWEDFHGMWEWEWDERYTPLTYLEKEALQLESKRITELFVYKGLTLEKLTSEMSPEECIIEGFRNNTHIHGIVNKLEDIKAHITEDSYDYQCNSNDANGKKILCGETKYFYDYNNLLQRGVVWHNINNMWWVICNGDLKNIAAFNLFDYSPTIRTKRPVNEKKIKALLSMFAERMEYERCAAIRDYWNRIRVESL